MTSNAGGTNSSNSAATLLFGNTPLTPARALAASSFLAGDESISIVPSFTYPEPIRLISGSVGPFRAGMNTVVPIWLATMLRRRKLAKIIPPPWMDVDVLREVLRFERDPNEASFSGDLPFRHAEIARAIMSACRAGSGTGAAAGDGGDSEIPNADQIKLLLEDIATVRMEKIRRNVHTLSSQTLTRISKRESIIDVTNIGSVEMHAIKPFVTEAFRMHREISGTGSSYSYPIQPRSEGSRLGEGGSAETAASASRARLSGTTPTESEDQSEATGSARDSDGENQSGNAGEDARRSRIRRHR